MKINTFVFVCCVSILLLFFNACTFWEDQPPDGKWILARKHFLKGQTFLKNEELVQAEIEFKQALAMVPEFVPALDGLAQLALARNDLALAETWLKRAETIQNQWLPLGLTKARLKFLQGEYEKSLAQLKQIELQLKRWQLDSLQNEVNWLKWLNLMRLNRWEQASQLLPQLDVNRSSPEEWQSFLAMPSDFDVLVRVVPASFRYLIFKKVVTREELAGLLTAKFPALPLVPKELWQNDPFVSVADVRDLPADNTKYQAIRTMIGKHILWVFPDHRFYPRDFVTRGELAIVLYRLFAAQKQQVPLIKTYLPLKDVEKETPLWPAVQFVVNSKMMSVFQPHLFAAQKKVSGLEVLRALHHLQRL